MLGGARCSSRAQRARECGQIKHAAVVLHADWATPAAIKAQFATASVLKDGRVVFNLGGNKYRLVVWSNYPYRVVYVRFIGTHRQYDAIDAQTI